MNEVPIGSPEHKALFCASFMETHDPFKPEEIVWPDLDEVALARLRSLPIWDEAAQTEAATAIRIQSLGDTEPDPVLARSISLQAYEESRHAEVIHRLTKQYGIEITPYPKAEVPSDPIWAFVRTGYGECLDSFFAFGLFRIGSDSGLFPAGLLSIFERIMQEEARHILFIVNWAAYVRAQHPVALRPVFDARRAWNIGRQAFARVKGAMQMASGEKSKKGFTLQSRDAFGDFSLRPFLELCLSENDRRFKPYDQRLLRPEMVPSAVRALVRVLPRRPKPSVKAA